MSDRHIFMQQTPPPEKQGRGERGGDCVAWQINFPLPHTHLISHVALIQPLLSPLASADWLTYGIVLFCFSSSPPVTWEPNSASCQSLLVFVWKKRKYHFLFFFKYIFLSFFLNPLNQRHVSIWHNIQVVSLYEQQQTGVTMLCNAPPPAGGGGEYLLLPVIYWGSPKVKTQMLAFSTVRKCTKGVFILHWLKAHLQHAFDISVTQGYHTVHHSSCDGSLKGRLHYSLLLACFNIRENGLMASRPYH